MIGKLELKLKSQAELAYPMSSLFHGVLMELLPAEYAEVLHISQLHPYAQHLAYRDGDWYWVVCCLNEESVQKIIRDTLWDLKKIHIKKNDQDVTIVQKQYTETSTKDLMESFYSEDKDSYIQIHFISPTAFKQQGKYVFYPNLHCIFQSLMNKYDVAAVKESMTDADTLESLEEGAEIIRYDLKSVKFPIEKVRIPAFIGKITIKMKGTQTMTNFAHMLFEFGEFSGVGIKTSLGMGCIKIMEERGKI